MAGASSPSTATSTTTATGSQPAAPKSPRPRRAPTRRPTRPRATADRAQAAADRQARLVARRPLVKELEQIDKRLAAWNKEKAELDAKLADPALYTGPQAGEVPALNKRQAELAERIEEAELRWLELHEALEAIPAD